ncbi:MAG: hypothetical protein MUE46_14295 [Xanthomonadales bacterium]|jgi:hypothetical protein|nr:hypothetical protein [Xanthomonadales bacterium]
MEILIRIGLVGVAVIHLLPVSGVTGAAALQRLYGLAISDPNLLILLQHRAVLFAIVGLLQLVAVFRAEWRPLALAVGAVSVLSFLVVALLVGDYNAAIARVVWADVLALVLLGVSAVGVWRR